MKSFRTFTMLLILCVLAIIPTNLAASLTASPSISVSSATPQTPDLSSSSSVSVAPVLPSSVQSSTAAQIAPSSLGAQSHASSSSVSVTFARSSSAQPTTAAQTAPSSSGAQLHASSSSVSVTSALSSSAQPSSTAQDFAQPTTAAQIAGSSSQAQPHVSSTSVFVVPVLTPAASASSSAVVTSPGHSSPSPSPTRSSSVAPQSSVAFVIYKSYASNQNECKNGGTYLVGPNNMKFCLCKDNYYGSACDQECNALFKPLVYALAGTSGFLLLVICIALLMACKRRNEYNTGSHELDSFNNIGLRAKGKVNESLIIE